MNEDSGARYFEISPSLGSKARSPSPTNTDRGSSIHLASCEKEEPSRASRVSTQQRRA